MIRGMATRDLGPSSNPGAPELREQVPRPGVGAARRRTAAECTTSRSICADPERTIRFYQDLLGFPLVELFENRDYEGSSHFFFDIGNRNMLAFFDFPGLGLEPVPEGLGGVQHVAISVTPEVFEAAKVRLADAGIDVPRARHGRRGVDLLQGPRQHPGRADPPAALRDARERAAGVSGFRLASATARARASCAWSS